MEKLSLRASIRVAPAKPVSESVTKSTVNTGTVCSVADNSLVREFSLLTDPGLQFTHYTLCHL